MTFPTEIIDQSYWPHWPVLLTSLTSPIDLINLSYWSHWPVLLTSLTSPTDLIDQSYWPHWPVLLTIVVIHADPTDHPTDLTDQSYWPNWPSHRPPWSAVPTTADQSRRPHWPVPPTPLTSPADHGDYFRFSVESCLDNSRSTEKCVTSVLYSVVVVIGFARRNWCLCNWNAFPWWSTVASSSALLVVSMVYCCVGVGVRGAELNKARKTQIRLGMQILCSQYGKGISQVIKYQYNLHISYTRYN